MSEARWQRLEVQTKRDQEIERSSGLSDGPEAAGGELGVVVIAPPAPARSHV
jgi:hypothetical protein